MSRAVYVSGFGCGKATETQQCALSTALNVEDIDVLTIAEARKNPDLMRKIGRGVPIGTHSAGALAIEGVGASELHLFNPPLRSCLAALSIRAAFGFMRDAASVTVHPDAHMLEVLEASRQEMSKHFLEYLRMIPAIQRFDAFEALQEREGLRVVTWTTDDHFFDPGVLEVAKARTEGIRVIEGIQGGHSQVVFRPHPTLMTYASRLDASPASDTRKLYVPAEIDLQLAS